MSTRWRVSRYSSNGGNCVEVAGSLTWVRVRDTKNRTGPELGLSPRAWAAFLTAIPTLDEYRS